MTTLTFGTMQNLLLEFKDFVVKGTSMMYKLQSLQELCPSPRIKDGEQDCIFMRLISQSGRTVDNMINTALNTQHRRWKLVAELFSVVRSTSETIKRQEIEPV